MILRRSAGPGPRLCLLRLMGAVVFAVGAGVIVLLPVSRGLAAGSSLAGQRKLVTPTPTPRVTPTSTKSVTPTPTKAVTPTPTSQPGPDQYQQQLLTLINKSRAQKD
jgi:hypothetical protein